MSLISEIKDAIMPSESDEDRTNARKVAEAEAGPDDWLSLVLDHHREIEASFSVALSGAASEQRMKALERLATVLTGHAQAEESVLYPALVENGEKADATMGYEEQAMVKVKMAKLQMLDPQSDEWRDQLEEIRTAVLHHVYEEEGKWLPELHQTQSPDMRAHLTQRFSEEFQRYTGSMQ